MEDIIALSFIYSLANHSYLLAREKEVLARIETWNPFRIKSLKNTLEIWKQLRLIRIEAEKIRSRASKELDEVIQKGE